MAPKQIQKMDTKSCQRKLKKVGLSDKGPLKELRQRQFAQHGNLCFVNHKIIEQSRSHLSCLCHLRWCGIVCARRLQLFHHDLDVLVPSASEHLECFA